jgi:hypothetical protein
MDRTRIDLLSALARDASLERSDYLVRAAEQFQRFLDANAHAIKEIGGLTLIDEDPDYLSIAPGPELPQPEPLPRRRDRRVAQRDRGRRVGRRARRAVQPGRAVHGLHRRRPGGRGPGG